MAWPSSCTISEANSSSTLTTVVRYAIASELCSVVRNGPDSMKISTNRIRNQLASTPIRNPNTSINLIEVDRRNILQWCHRRPGDLPGAVAEIQERRMSGRLEVLRDRMGQLVDLSNIGHLLHWDQQTMMPPRGGPARAETLATLERISHDLFVSDETGRLLDAADSEIDGSDPDSDDARLVRVVMRRWEKARRVPTDLAGEIARAASIGQEVWIGARANCDFEAFALSLEHTVELPRRYIACFEGVEP